MRSRLPRFPNQRTVIAANSVHSTARVGRLESGDIGLWRRDTRRGDAARGTAIPCVTRPRFYRAPSFGTASGASGPGACYPRWRLLPSRPLSVPELEIAIVRARREELP